MCLAHIDNLYKIMKKTKPEVKKKAKKCPHRIEAHKNGKCMVCGLPTPIFKVTKTTGLPTKCKNCDPKPNKVIRTNQNSQCIDCGRQVGGVRPNRFADKDFSRFAPMEVSYDAYGKRKVSPKITTLPYEIEGDYKPTSWLNDKPNITRLEMYVAIFLGLLLGNVISDLIN